MSSQVMAAHQVVINGFLTGEGYANTGVYFGGAYMGNTTTDAYGFFSITTTQASLGTVYGMAMGSNQGQTILAKDPPVLSNLQITYGTQKNITITGTLSDLDAAGRTINFMGAASGSTTTNSSGQFSYTTSTANLGTLTVSGTDLWGQQGSSDLSIASNIPVIENFAVYNNVGNIWRFEGHVADEYAPGLTIRFGGNAWMTGRTTTVDANGNFSLVVELPEGATGTVTAVVTDWWGLDSEIVSDHMA